MTTTQFIEKAIEGGMKENLNWKFVSANIYWVVWKNGNGDDTTIAFEKYILDPLAWQAVGKVEGWNKHDNARVEYNATYHWKYCMHRMIDALAEGKSIEEYLKTL